RLCGLHGGDGTSGFAYELGRVDSNNRLPDPESGALPLGPSPMERSERLMIPSIDVMKQGQIVILNGAPRSGKSSIVTVIQETFDGPWMNLGVDIFAREVTPKRYRPGMGLRPGEEGHALAPLVPVFYAALYDSIAAHSRAGLDVVVDVGHHDAKFLADSARRLARLPVLFVGVRCPIEVIMQRRNAGQVGRVGVYAVGSETESVPPPVARWQRDVH